MVGGRRPIIADMVVAWENWSMPTRTETSPSNNDFATIPTRTALGWRPSLCGMESAELY